MSITRSSTEKTAWLLGYLTYFRARAHSREELIELFWPEADLDSGRMSLRTALSSLRRQIEPPDTPAQSVLVTDRHSVRLNSAAVIADIDELERAMRRAASASEYAAVAEALDAVCTLYRGDLLPGCPLDVIGMERDRIAANVISLLDRSAALCMKAEDWDRAITCAHRMIQIDRFHEPAYATLLRSYGASGRRVEALKHYQSLKRILRTELQETPSEEIEALAREMRLDSVDARSEPACKRRVPRQTDYSPLRGSAPDSESLTSGAVRPFASLPASLDRFFGRQTEFAFVTEMLERTGGNPSQRLITLLGATGCGKTRLAVETARRLQNSYARIHFVALSDMADPHLLSLTLLRSLGGAGRTDREPLEALIEVLAHQPTLLVLDNLEPLLAAGGSGGPDVGLLVRLLLERVPTLSILVSSQRALAIAGEQEVRVSPLPLPPKLHSPARLMECASIQLFVDRAQRKRPDFQLTERNAPLVAEVCERLEGVPLAIELAAALVNVLTLRQILDQLNEGYGFLVEARRSVHPRECSLAAAIEWSCRLLPPAARRFLFRLSVFRGGCDLAAAQDVCREPDAFAYTAQLISHSLVFPDDQGEAMRYGLLGAVRAYAWEQLDPREREELCERHGEYLLRFVREVSRGSKAHSDNGLVRLECELDNLRAALNRWIQSGQASVALELFLALDRFWYWRGHQAEARRWLEAILASEVCSSAERARALDYAGTLAHSQGDYPAAQAAFRQSLAVFEEFGDRQGTAEALNGIGLAAYSQGDYTLAQTSFERSLILMRQCRHDRGIAYTLNLLAGVASDRGDYDRARGRAEESLAIFERLHDRDHVACALRNLGQIAYRVGDLVRAEAHFARSLHLACETGNKPGIAGSEINLGLIACHLDNGTEAHDRAERGRQIAHEMGDRHAEARALYALGMVAHRQGNAALSVELLARSLRLQQDHANAFQTVERLEALAGATADRRPERAALLLGACSRLREAAGIPVPPLLRAWYDDRVAAARTLIGDDWFGRSWRAGHRLSPEEVVAYALSLDL